MSATPFFSVIVPTYNMAQYLGQALDSLLAQTDGDWDCVIVNDGSIDDTAEVIADYCSRDDRFRAFDKENGGTASAMNEGLKHVRGEWICWLQSDDLFKKDKLAIHREWIREAPDSRFFSGPSYILDDSTGNISEEEFGRAAPPFEWQVIKMLKGNFVQTLGICIRRDLWTETGVFDPACGYGQDYDMWLRMLARSPVTVISTLTCTTRDNSARSTRDFKEALLYGSARSGIAFLNNNRFEALFPLVDLTDPEAARTAVNIAIDVANSPHSYVYALGAHLQLILRIMEWLWRYDGSETARSLRPLFRQRAWICARGHKGTVLGELWQAAALAAQVAKQPFQFEQMDPVTVAETNYWFLGTAGDKAADPLQRYLEKFEDRSIPTHKADCYEAGEKEFLRNEMCRLFTGGLKPGWQLSASERARINLLRLSDAAKRKGMRIAPSTMQSGMRHGDVGGRNVEA